MDGLIKDTYGFMTFTNIFPIDANPSGLTTFIFTAPVTGSYSVQFTGKHSQSENVFFPVFLQLWKIKPDLTKDVVGDSEITISVVSFNIDTTFSMDEGDVLTPIVIAGGAFPVSAAAHAFIDDAFLTITPLAPKNIYNTLISAGDNLPDMSQTDFIKSIAKIFGIIFDTNSFTKTVEFKGFKTTYKRIPKAVDWTNKLDANTTNKNPVIIYHPKGYAQRNIFKWTNDTSLTLDEKLGEGEIIIDDKSLDEEKILIQVPFSATEMTKRLIDLDVPIIPFLKLGLPKGAQRPRLLIMERTSSVTIVYDDTVDSGSVNNNVPLCYFQLPGKTFNLGFDDSLITDNYAEFLFFLDKYKQLEAFYNLDENDIAELDFFTPVYDGNFQHYFFISKLNNFIEGRSTKAELIRL